ncbi:MAG: OadG family protein [Gammaproteobacteria bacterium]|nr:OadG family protein [Gammaproteobacteria bacterium]MCP5299625.1 OadG family protein [Chromatiaceae bacterium]
MQGVELMLLGMGIVFSFLAMLVFTLRGMSRLANLLDDRAADDSGPMPIQVADNRQLVAVIAAAIARYRSS